MSGDASWAGRYEGPPAAPSGAARRSGPPWYDLWAPVGMTRPLRLAAFAAALAAPWAAPPALAQARPDGPAPRVLFAVTDSVKLDDGTRGWVRTSVTYDPAAGEYVHLAERLGPGGAGTVLSRRVARSTVAGPTAEEETAAQALVAAHPALARVVAAAEHPVVVRGGFPLVRERGPCGPGSRCLSYDVVERPPGGAVRRLRYVVVDLGARRVVSADADPVADSNLAHPAARRASRSW